MIRAVLDGGEISSREALHDALARELALPSYYGRNLDALLDCLTEPREETVLRICRFGALESSLGRYAGALRAVLERAAEEDPRLTVAIED